MAIRPFATLQEATDAALIVGQEVMSGTLSTREGVQGADCILSYGLSLGFPTNTGMFTAVNNVGLTAPSPVGAMNWLALLQLILQLLADRAK